MNSNTTQTILVVDRDAALRGELQSYLTGQGYRVVLAENNEAAWERLNEVLPHLIILELGEPLDKTDYGKGDAMSRSIRDNEATEHIPILALAEQWTRTDDIKELFFDPIDDVLLKPFDTQELALRLRHLLIDYKRRYPNKF